VTKKPAYLTIDDGPTVDFEQKLAILDQRNIPAIWFCRGDYLDARPQMAQEAIARGVILANHSYNHPHFSQISLEQAYDEIRRTDAVLADLYHSAGVEWQHKFFRFPYGDKGALNQNPFTGFSGEGLMRKDSIQTCLRDLGYVQLPFADVTYPAYRQFGLLDDVDWYWTYDCREWEVWHEDRSEGIDSLGKVNARMDIDSPDTWHGLNRPGSAEIILTHDHTQTTPLFEAMIDHLLTKDLDFKLPL